ncbi:MAG: hypothetical protein U0234_33535 [Sandaracinus sp.]
MIPASIYPDADVLTGAVRVLGHVDALPLGATGVLVFGSQGSILVEAGRVCWAVASSMPHRLSDLLRHQRSPPLERRFLEDVLLTCQTERRPLGEALLASGQVSEPGLRTALFRQTVEAIAHLGRGIAEPTFRARERAAYDARFLFSTPEIYAALGARRDRVMAITARRHLEAVATPDTTAIGFSRDDPSFPHPPLAISSGGPHRVDELRAGCSWAAGVLDLVAVAHPDAFLVVGAWHARGSAVPGLSAVAWTALGLHFCALCRTRAASAVLTSRVTALRRSAP